MNAATSPVCAPSSFSVEQSCAATLILEPSSRSQTVFSAVKTGAITTSQWFAFATSGFNASAVSTESLSVLYIFQFPAITGLRIILFLVFCALFFALAEVAHLANKAQSTKLKDLLLTQRGDAGQFCVRQKLQRCTTTRRDVRDAIRNTRAAHGRDGVTAADDRGRTSIRCFSHSLRDPDRSLIKRRLFKHAHGTIPNDRARILKRRRKMHHRFNADIHSYQTEVCKLDRYRLRYD